MMWIFYEVLLNIYEGFLYTWFITKILGKKSYESWSFISCALLVAFAYSTYLIWSMPSWDTWVFMIIVLYSIIFLNGSIAQKLFWNLILIVMVMGIIGIYYQIFQFILGADINILLENGMPRLFFTLSCNILLWLFLFLITRFFSKKTSITPPSYLLMIALLLCAVLIDVFFHLTNQFSLPLIWLFLGCLIAVSLGIVTLAVYQFLEKYTRIEQEYRFRKQLMEDSEKQIAEMKELYGSAIKLRHDMRAFVRDIKEMAERGEISRTPLYMDMMENDVLPLYSTGNQSLDSVLMIKTAKIRAAGIEFRGTNLHYTGGMNIRDTSLCSLVSNMLDNALEALLDRKDREGERYIFLGFNYSMAGLIIICENPLLGVLPKMVKASFFSKKTEPYHGLGISIMERIAHDASGQLEIRLYEDCFRVLALIPPKKDAAPDASAKKV